MDGDKDAIKKLEEETKNLRETICCLNGRNISLYERIIDLEHKLKTKFPGF